MAIGFAVLSVVMTATGLVFFAIAPAAFSPPGLGRAELISYLILEVSFTGVGALLVWRRPSNIIGWLLSIGGIVSGFEFATGGYAVYGLYSGALPNPLLAAWLYSVSGIGLGFFVGVIPGVFPDGRPRTRAGRLAIVFLLYGLAMVLLAIAVRPGPLARFPIADNPFAFADDAALVDMLLVGGLGCGAVAVVLGTKQFVDRVRTATLVERQQLKWFLWSGGVLMAASAIIVPVVLSPGSFDSLAISIANLFAGLATASLPIAIGIAIMRYGLYDIDLLIKRSVVYAATSAAIVASFFAGTVALQLLLRPLTAGGEVAVAASTLVSFALFQPIRRRIQDAVDRRFDRSRYDAARVLDAFADRLRDEVNLDAVRADLIGAVRETMQPRQASLWLREPLR